MAGVNLLPQGLRTGRTARRSLVIPLAFLLVASCLLGVQLRMQGVLASQEERKADLQRSIGLLQQVKVRRDLLGRLEGELAAVKGEFAARTVWSAYTDELAARLPFGVVLKDLRADGTKLSFAATADTMGQVAQFITNVNASPWFKEPSVSQLTVTWSGTRVTKVDFGAVIEIVPGKQQAVRP